ncbi:hypothetical protein SLE2022_398650 [Rubroshorea leprosula]
MFSGGSELSSTMVDWAMAEMVKNPEVLEKAQKEVRRVFDKQGDVDEASIHELRYLTAVIKETLIRLHPSLPLLLPRETLEFIPFGAGMRVCPGISFALPNIELPLAKLLYHFDWKLPNGMKGEDIDMISEAFGITVRTNDDLILVPTTY